MEKKYYWPLYEKPVYWDMPDDGAKFKCDECGERFHHTKVWLTQIPNGDRAVYCKECLEPDWLELAEYKGVFLA